ncbi:glycosyltransferase [Micromonospora sp. NPDC094482]|uniref:glycosyltransferase n=1 Tax=unclassified Micromonospora TaxID=2617518 RepID=UPI0033290D63
MGIWGGAVLLQTLVIVHLTTTWWTSLGVRLPLDARVTRWDGTVDVLITVCGEDLDVVRLVIRAARDMRIAHNTWVLDDGDSQDLHAVCQEEGVRYLNRADRSHGKAGNVNHALRQTRGDFVAVFDADHVPDTAFLARTLGYFVDVRVAFVQTPQNYLPRSTLAARGARQAQSAFYRYLMPGKARHGAAICVGTNVVFRRSALDLVEGLYRHSHSEDVHTSLRLHCAGLRSVFVPDVLAVGLPPLSWRAYLGQQRRWARGAFEVLLSAVLWRSSRLNATQRWQYASLGTHYLTSVIGLAFSLLPVCLLLGDVSPVTVSPVAPLLLFVSGLLSIAVANRIQTGSAGLAAMLAHVLATPAHALGLVDALIRRTSGWVPTHGRQRPSPFSAAYVILGVLAVANLLAVLMGAARTAARGGYAGAAAALGVPSADGLWLAFPLAWCAAQAALFLLPAIARLRRARLGARASAVVALLATASVAVAASLPPRPSRPAPPAPGVWRDDFDGPAGQLPSPADWIVQTGHHYPGGPTNWGTGEIQRYERSPRNVRLDGTGNLIITATVDGDGQYHSARIETRRADLAPPTGGTLRMQARVRLPAARGSWATFWALGSSFRRDLRWPQSGEIDVIEYRGSAADEVYGVLHCPGCNEPVGRRARHHDAGGLTGDFHTYTVDWHAQPRRIDWYVDGAHYQSITPEAVDGDWAFDQPVFLLVNLAVGGWWPGQPSPEDYPAHMVVDYIEARACRSSCAPLEPRRKG